MNFGRLRCTLIVWSRNNKTQTPGERYRASSTLDIDVSAFDPEMQIPI